MYPVVVVGGGEEVVELPPPLPLVLLLPPLGGVTGARLLTLLLGDGVTTGSGLVLCGTLVVVFSVCVTTGAGEGIGLGEGVGVTGPVCCFGLGPETMCPRFCSDWLVRHGWQK